MMFMGDLLPAALATWMPRRAITSGAAQASRPQAASLGDRQSPAGALPHGLIAVEPEVQIALAAISGFACRRCIELQMAVEPRLFVKADAAEYQACLRRVILNAVGRASSGVLVTAMLQGDSVEIAVLDDGAAPPGGRPESSTPAWEPSAPLGGTLRVEYQPGRGTTVLLRLPQARWRPLSSHADAMDGMAAAATH